MAVPEIVTEPVGKLLVFEKVFPDANVTSEVCVPRTVPDASLAVSESA